LLARYKYVEECRDFVTVAMEKGDYYLIFDKQCRGWMFFDRGGERHKALFVIMPSGIHWKITGNPAEHKRAYASTAPSSCFLGWIDG